MTALEHRSTQGREMHHKATDPHVCDTDAGETAGISGDDSARLEAIHERVRSGSYHIPASAIADRMVERLLIDRRGTTS